MKLGFAPGGVKLLFQIRSSRAHPDTAPVWSSAFRRLGTFTASSRVNAELRTKNQITLRAVQGVANATQELTRIYADLVRQSSPVVEVGPSKDITVVVTEGVWIEVKDVTAAG